MHNFELARNFVSCQTASNEFTEFVEGGGDVAGDGDDGADALAPFFVGGADDGKLGGQGVGDHKALDLGGVDVFAAANDHVLDTVGDKEESVLVSVPAIACFEPLAVEGRGGSLGVVPVARGHVRTADLDLALHAWFVDNAPGAVDDSHVAEQRWPTGRSALLQRVLRREKRSDR